jgi:hypothetical protein
MKVDDLKIMLEKLEKGEITYVKFRNYVDKRPSKPRTYTRIGEWD